MSKKRTLLEKLFTEDWMTTKQLAILTTIRLIAIAVMDYMAFIAANEVFGSMILSGILSIAMLVFAVTVIAYRIRQRYGQ